MTILPKKKHQESRKNEQDHDADNRNRTRNRCSRETRNRVQQQPDDIGSVPDTPGNVLLQASPVYNDLDTREPQEGTSLPHKRTRHRQTSTFFIPQKNSSNNALVSSRSNSREGSASPNVEADEDGYNSSDEHGTRSCGNEVYNNLFFNAVSSISVITI